MKLICPAGVQVACGWCTLRAWCWSPRRTSPSCCQWGPLTARPSTRAATKCLCPSATLPSPPSPSPRPPHLRRPRQVGRAKSSSQK